MILFFLPAFTHSSILSLMATGNKNASDFDAIMVDHKHPLYLHLSDKPGNKVSIQLTDSDNYEYGAEL